MTFLSLLDELIETINSINKRLCFSRELKEDLQLDLSNLLKESLNIIEDLEKHFDDINEFNVDDVNNKIDTLMNSLSITFLLEKRAKSTWTVKELKLYKSLLSNLHNLSEQSIEFESKHRLGLRTFDRFNLSIGLKLLKEGFNKFWEDFSLT